jgi:putative endonuclease
MSKVRGYAAEELAKQYLLDQGLVLLESNYNTRCGELDLIMMDNKCVVFVEVRARVSRKYGGAAETINWVKRNKLMRTAQTYLSISKIRDTFPIRFDVITLEGNPYQINWIKNAFGTDSFY